MAWWRENKLRMIQNNLRDIDAGMDVKGYVQTLVDFGANACMVGCGGITAFYPTSLEFQRRSPYLKGDFFGSLVEECHRNDIRVIARFDFSKTHESIYQKHPGWYTKSIHGEPVRYHDTVATCVSGEYQQERILDILEEVVTRYPVDGVFFNMFGFQTRDYSGNYTGICQCDSCKRRFWQACGEPLPTKEDDNDPVFRRYREFKQQSVDSLLEKISAKVRSLNPAVAVCTYNHKGVDMVRNESNSAVDRPYPFWLYASENNVGVVRGSYEDKISSNCVINAVDIYYRFMGVSKQLNQIRLYGEMAAGSGLDWCIIGSFEDYPDRDNFDMAKEVFRFHQKHQRYFGKLESLARILLVNPSPFGAGGEGAKEYLGIFKMLKEDHRLFDVVEEKRLGELGQRLKQYEVVILPGTPALSPTARKALLEASACVVGTGLALEGRAELQELFGVELGEEPVTTRGSYLQTEPKTVFRHFPKRDWVYLDKRFRPVKAGGKALLPLVNPARYGPPERCYGHEVSQDAYGAAACRGSLYLPWQPGALYYEHGYEDFKYILLDLMDSVRPVARCVQTNATGQVELFFDRCGPRAYLLQLLNLSGFNGTTVFDPVPVHGIEVWFEGLRPQKACRLTADGREELPAGRNMALPVLGQYAAYVIEMEE